MRSSENFDWLGQTFFFQEFQEGGVLAPRQNQSRNTLQVANFLDQPPALADPIQRFSVGFEVALQGQDSNRPHRGYQPRVCSRSFSSICAISSPRIASPSSSEACSN